MRRLLAPALLLWAGPVLAAGPLEGTVQQQATNWPAIFMFLFFVLFTLGITYKAAKGTKSAADFYLEIADSLPAGAASDVLDVLPR